MTSIGSPTLRAHKLIQQNVTSIRQRLETVRTEAVTGQVSDVARAVNGDTAKVNKLTQSIAYAKDRASILELESNRASTVQTTLGIVRDQISSTMSVTTLALNGTVPKGPDSAEALAQSGFDEAVMRLNSDFAGRAMFGGDSGTAPLIAADTMMETLKGIVAAAPDVTTALADIDTYFDDPTGGFATTAFKGGDGDAPGIEISRTERISPTVRADDDALRKTLKAFAVTALAGETSTDTDRTAMLEQGNSLLREANEDMIDLQSRLGVREERIAVAQANFSAQETSLSIALNALTGRDQAEAATEMRLLESQLEAAYLTTSRMANLSLTNFLR